MRERNAPPGLNAIGKPYGENFDPNYKMKYRPSYGHLRHPYGSSMRFVGDPPRTDEKRKRGRPRQLPPAPLLDGQFNNVFDMTAAAKLLHGVEKLINTLRRAMLKAAEKSEQAATSQERKLEKPRSTPANTILEDRVQVDLIDRLENVRGILETTGANGMPLVLVDNALRGAIEHLIQQRERRLASR
jgi:hypothetical protein